MWVLVLQHRDGKRQTFHLVFGGDYTIGRKGCDILIENADISISRLHAKLTVLSVPAGSLADITFIPELYLADCSKHGTFVNEAEVFAIEASKKITPRDKIRFGKHVTASITYSPIVVSLSSTLTTAQESAIINATGKIGGILAPPLRPDELHKSGVSPFMFVYCTNEVSGEPSALLAMMCGYILVAAEYVPDLFIVMRDSCRVPLSCLPQPGNFDAMRTPLLADRPYHRPEPAIYGPHEFLTMPPREPEAIFRTLHFVFLDSELASIYAPIVQLGGGALATVEPAAVLQWEPSDDELPLLGLVDVVKSHGLSSLFVVGKDVFRVVLEVLLGHAAVTDPTDAAKPEVRALVRLWSLGFKLMHEENLHVSVYCADTAGQVADAAPGILLKSAMPDIGGPSAGDDSDCDSQATCDGYSPAPVSAERRVGVANVVVTPRRERRAVVTHEPQQLVASPASDGRGSAQTARSQRQRGEKGSGSGNDGREAEGQPLTLYEQFRATLQERAIAEDEAEAAVAANGSRRSPPRRARASSSPQRTRLGQAATAPSTAVSTLPPTLQFAKSPIRTRKPAHSLQNETPEERLVSTCIEFTTQTLNVVSARVEQECRHSIKQKYMSAPTKQFLEATALRVTKFLSNVAAQLSTMRGKPLSAPAAKLLAETKDRSETLFGAINATANVLAVQLALST